MPSLGPCHAANTACSQGPGPGGTPTLPTSGQPGTLGDERGSGAWAAWPPARRALLVLQDHWPLSLPSTPREDRTGGRRPQGYLGTY